MEHLDKSNIKMAKQTSIKLPIIYTWRRLDAKVSELEMIFRNFLVFFLITSFSSRSFLLKGIFVHESINTACKKKKVEFRTKCSCQIKSKKNERV